MARRPHGAGRSRRHMSIPSVTRCEDAALVRRRLALSLQRVSDRARIFVETLWVNPSLASAFLTARGAPPPLALARRLRASLRPQALLIARLCLLQRQPSTANVPDCLRVQVGSRIPHPGSRQARYLSASVPISGPPTVKAAM